MGRRAVLYCCGFFILASPGENTTSYVGILWKLRLAVVVCFIIRKRRLAYVVCIDFTNEEYHVIRVDFIVALRRTKGRGRRTLRSPPSPSSGLHLIHPGLSAAAGHICCRGFIPIQVAVFRCYRYSPVPNFIWLSVFGLESFAFQLGCWAMVARFSLLGDRSFVPAATVGFAMAFCRICADRDWVVCFCGWRYGMVCIVSSLGCMENFISCVEQLYR